jgi:TRAP-type C4-dicarboxylate transport system permease small subunit
MIRLPGLFRSIVSVIDRGSVLLGWIAIGALATMMILTGTDVFLRYFFGRSVLGIVEVVGNYFMVAVVFLPLAFGVIKGGHITVDFVVSRIGARRRTAMEVLGLALALFAFSLITWYGAEGALHAWETGDTMVNVGLSIWPGKALVPLGALFLCLQILLSICSKLKLLFRQSGAGDKSRTEKGYL